MALTEFFTNPAFPRALMLGAFGGVGLALTVIYSRRGPMIYPAYAALFATLTLLLARYSSLAFVTRFAAGLAAFLLASSILYVTVGVLANRERRRLVAAGRLPESALHARLSLWGHTWRLAFLMAVGTPLCLGIAFIAG